MDDGYLKTKGRYVTDRRGRERVGLFNGHVGRWSVGLFNGDEGTHVGLFNDGQVMLGTPHEDGQLP